MSGHLAVDLGTSRTSVADSSGRLLVDEPSVAAVNLADGSLVAFGAAALAMQGRSAGEVEIVRPVARGQLQDLGLTDQVAVHLLSRLRQKVGRRPEVLCSVPGLASGVQRRAMERAFKSAGASHVDFIEHAVAAGIGFRLRIDEPVANMVVDVGAGTTDVAVMALGGVVTGASLPIGGDDLDKDLRELLLRSFDLVVTSPVAEQVKRAVGSAGGGAEEKVEVTGRDFANGLARTVVLSTSEASNAIADHVKAMLAAVVGCIVEAPPDLANDLLAKGLHLAGEGGLLRGFSRSLATATGIPVHLADQAGRAAVLGAARCMREVTSHSAGRDLRPPAGRPDPQQPA